MSGCPVCSAVLRPLRWGMRRLSAHIWLSGRLRSKVSPVQSLIAVQAAIGGASGGRTIPLDLRMYLATSISVARYTSPRSLANLRHHSAPCNRNERRIVQPHLVSTIKVGLQVADIRATDAVQGVAAAIDRQRSIALRQPPGSPLLPP